MGSFAENGYFTHELFKKGNDGSVKEGKPRYLMSDLVPNCTVGYEAFLVFLHRRNPLSHITKVHRPISYPSE